MDEAQDCPFAVEGDPYHFPIIKECPVNLLRYMLWPRACIHTHDHAIDAPVDISPKLDTLNVRNDPGSQNGVHGRRTTAGRWLRAIR